MERSYEIEPRAPELGGGYRLRMIEDGEEVGGGVFPISAYINEARELAGDWKKPPEEIAEILAYEDAAEEGASFAGLS